jgi:hypothetical protein
MPGSATIRKLPVSSPRFCLGTLSVADNDADGLRVAVHLRDGAARLS